MKTPPDQNHRNLIRQWNWGRFASFCIRLGLACVLLANFIYVGTYLPRLDNAEGLWGILILVAVVVGKFLDNWRHEKGRGTKKRPILALLSIGGFLVLSALGFLFFPRTATFYSNPWGMPWLPPNSLSGTAWLFFGMLAFAEWGFLSHVFPAERAMSQEEGFFWAAVGGIALVGSNYWIFPVVIGLFLVTFGICTMLIRKPEENVKDPVRQENSPNTNPLALTGRRKRILQGVLGFFTGTCGAFWVGFVALACVSFDHLNVLLSICVIFAGVWYILIHSLWSRVQAKIRGVLPRTAIGGLFLGIAGILTFLIKQSLLTGAQDLWFEVLFANVLGFFLSFIMLSLNFARGLQQSSSKLGVEKNRVSFVWISLFLAAGGYLGSRTLDPSNYNAIFPALVIGFGVILFLAILVIISAKHTIGGGVLV